MNERHADFELLREFTRRGDQESFATVVRRHLDLVYAAALRKLEDPGAAEEVAQNVFATLARKAWRFGPDDSLPAWLYRATLLEAREWLRGELRRRRREQAAAELGTTMKTPDEQTAFRALVPLLDEALLSLREKDRTALLLRFHEGRSLRDVGLACGLNEDAAQKRVAGALERLADFFRRRGYRTASMATAAAALQHTAAAAPAYVTASVLQTVIPAASTLTGIAILLAPLLALTRLQKGLVCVALLSMPVLWHWNSYRPAEAAAPARPAEPTAGVVPGQQPPASTPPARPEMESRGAGLAAPPAETPAAGVSRPQKEHSVHLRGFIDASDVKLGLLEIQHHSLARSNTPPFTVRKVMAEGETFDDRSVKDAYVTFEFLGVLSEDCSVRIRENGVEGVYPLEGRNAVPLRAGPPGVCLVDVGFEEFLDVYAAVLGRTLLCHPTTKAQRSIRVIAAARDRMAVIAVLERSLRENAGAVTLLDGDRLALVVPTNLVKAVSAAQAAKVYPSSTNEVLPAGTIYLRSVSLSQVLPLYGELIGRKFVQNDPLPASSISFHNETALTRAEMIYAFDILFGWQRLKVVLVGENSFKVSPVTSR
jgi:RNA polymerase sigma factor (sigma-70 family)